MKEPSQNYRADESLLWQSLKNGSHQAFTEIYERYHAMMYSYVMKIHNDPQRVMDVIQDVFIDLWKMRENLADIEDENIRYYLFKATTRRMNRHLQLAAVINEKIQAGAAYLFPEPVSNEEILINKETYDHRIQLLTGAIKKLTRRQQSIINLRFIEGFSVHEIASILLISQQTVRNLIQIAIRKLKKHLVLQVLFFALPFLF